MATVNNVPYTGPDQKFMNELIKKVEKLEAQVKALESRK